MTALLIGGPGRARLQVGRRRGDVSDGRPCGRVSVRAVPGTWYSGRFANENHFQ